MSQAPALVPPWHLCGLRTDPEFASLIPPLTREERQQLQENILAEGCREPLIAWEAEPGHNPPRLLLLDGHNRREICEWHAVPYQVRLIDLPDRAAAIDWIINNQLGRRNLTPDQASYLRGKRYLRQRNGHGGPREPSGHFVHLPTTAERLAEEYKVDEKTIRRDGEFAEAVDTLAANTGEETRQAILSGEAGLPKKDVIDLAQAPPEEQREAVKDLAVHYSSKTPEWLTPPGIIGRVVDLLGAIDLDPASNTGEPNVPAARHLTEADDGLSHEWAGRVYLNPPYGAGIGDWVNKLISEHASGLVTEAVALLPARTDTQWFRRLAGFRVCFICGRLNFSGHENSAPFPSAIFYLGPRREAFARAFADLGLIYEQAP